MPMHDVTPKVVAIAVSTVMITCNTLLQICLLSLLIVFVVFRFVFSFFRHGLCGFFASLKELHGFYFLVFP